jgi:uncharacterized membrane protein (TIGR02234 family)
MTHVHTPAGRPGAAVALRSRAGLVLVACACVVIGGLALLAAGRGWVTFSVAEPPLPPLRKAVSGHTVASAVTPLALVVLAGVVALPATRRVGRRLAGVLLALAGAGLVIASADVLASPAASVKGAAARLMGRTGVRPTEVAVSGWPWLVVVLGAVTVVVGAVVVAFSGGWPAMGRRYEASQANRADRADRAGPSSGRAADERSMWDRIDEGDDPTV